MNYYETLYIVHPALEAGRLKDIILSIESIFSNDTSNIHSTQVWGKKKFMGVEFMGIVRTTFLLDKKRNIIKTWKNVKVKDHAKDVLNTLKSI